MKVTVNLDTLLASVTPDRVKTAHQRVVVVFERGGRKVSLDGASLIFGCKIRGTFDLSPQVVYHDEFLRDGTDYTAEVNFATDELYNALGLADGTAANDKPQVELSGEVVWVLADRRYRSQTFRLIVESAILEGEEPTPVGFPEYLKAGEKGAPGGIAELDSDRKVPAAQLPQMHAAPEFVSIPTASSTVAVALTNFGVINLTMAGDVMLEEDGEAVPGSRVEISIFNPDGHELTFGESIEINWADKDALPLIPSDGCIVGLLWQAPGKWKGVWRE